MRIEIEGGKYTIINELNEGGGFRALRYGEEWRNLAGDKMVLALAQEVESLQKHIDELQKDVQFLDCLKAAGVDNWPGYSDAWEMMNEEEA